MKSTVVKRSIVINGHKTSVSLEEPFWVQLKAIAWTQRRTLSEVIATIDGARAEGSNLSSALRCFVLAQYVPGTTDIPHEAPSPEADRAEP